MTTYTMGSASTQRSWLRTEVASLLLALLFITVCTVIPSFAAFSNGGFESGSNGQAPPGWTVVPAINPGLAVAPPTLPSQLNLLGGGIAATVIRSNIAGPGSQIDSNLGENVSFRWPLYGNASAIVNNSTASQNANRMSQTFTVSANDVDPLDGKIHIRLAIAPILDNPGGHSPTQQAYAWISLTNNTQGTISHYKFIYSNENGVPWKASPTTGKLYTDWQIVDIAPGSASLMPGDEVKLEVIAAGCSSGGHGGSLYVDGVGTFPSGLQVVATAPQQINSNSTLTYLFTYQNGSSTAVNNVVIEESLPANTTFSALSAPGLTCSTPAVGGTGRISCTAGTLEPNTGGTIQLTVTVTGTAGATITNGNYSIVGDGLLPLLGPSTYTIVTSGVLYTDLAVGISDGEAAVETGEDVSYTITITNNGPNGVINAPVSSTIAAGLSSITWSCSGSGGGTCTASGSGSINDTVTLPPGGIVTYNLTATVSAVSGTLVNSVSVMTPGGTTDNNMTNNTAADVNEVGNLQTVSIAKTGTGSGTVASSPQAINCGPDCSASFLEGSLVTLQAYPAQGSVFTGWSGDCAGSSSSCSVTMNASRNIVAGFAIKTFTVSATPGPNGSITASASHNYGSSPVYTVTPDNGFFITSVTVDGVSQTVADQQIFSYTFTSISANHTIEAAFAPYPVDAFCGDASGRALIAAPTTDLCSFGAPTEVTGNGPWNWTCQGLYGGKDSPACSAGILQYTLIFQAASFGTVSPEGPQTVNYNGNSTAITATGNPGYHFVNWTGTNGFVTSTDNPLTVSAVKIGMTITANFAINAVNGVCGTAHGGTFTEAPATNLCDAGSISTISGSGPWTWQCGGLNFGSDADCSANIQQYTVSFQSTTGGTISCTPATVNHGAGSTCTIAADPGFALSTLTDNNSDVLSSIPSYTGGTYTISNMAENHDLQADFSPITYGSQRLTSNVSDDSSSDSAVDPVGNLHVVYQRDGNVYYRFHDRVGAYWLAEELVGNGNTPAIAAGANGQAQVVYLSGGSVMYRIRTFGIWSNENSIYSGSATHADIDVDMANIAHIALSANADGDQYQEILYTSNTSGSFTIPAILGAADGFHDDMNFFSMSYTAPSIKVDADGKYHIVCRLDYRDDLAGDAGSSHYFFYFSNRGSTQVSTSPTMIPWNTTVNMGRNGLALGENGKILTTYWVGNTVYNGMINPVSGLWSETTMDGSQSSVTSDGMGNIRLTWLETSGIAVSAAVANNVMATPFPMAPAGARNPVAHASFGHVIYENNSSGNWEVYAGNRLQHPLVSPAPYDFGMVPVGQGASQLLGIKNSGNRPLTVSSITLLTGTNFVITDETCTAGPIAANDSCAVTVAFSPQSAVALSDTLRLLTDEPGNGEILTSVSGSGAIVDGVCGASNDGTFAIPPTMELCSSGIPSTAVLSNGMWNWSCDSPNGGIPASCSASLQQYLLTVTFAGTGGTAITSPSHPGTIVCMAAAPGNNCSAAFDPGTIVTLSASANGTSELTDWAGSDSIFLGPTTVTMDNNKTVTASFNTIQQPVLIYGKIGYDFLGMALMTYQSSDSIMLKSTYNQMAENVLFNQPYSVSLTGGYGNSWTEQPGVFSMIKGSLKINAGKVTVKGIKIRP